MPLPAFEKSGQSAIQLSSGPYDNHYSDIAETGGCELWTRKEVTEDNTVTCVRLFKRRYVMLL